MKKFKRMVGDIGSSNPLIIQRSSIPQLFVELLLFRSPSDLFIPCVHPNSLKYFVTP